MVVEQIGAFLKAIIKYGGGNLVILLLSAWFFDSFFNINPDTIMRILDYLLWILFLETVFVLFVSRIFWVADKVRAFQSGAVVSDEINGKAITDVGKDIGLDILAAAATIAKDLVIKTPEQKIEKEISKIDKEIAKIDAN